MKKILGSMANLGLGLKLLLLSSFLLLPASLLLFYFIVLENSAIEFAQNEIHGAEYIEEIYPIQLATARHRGLMATYLNGDVTVMNSIADVERNMPALFSALDQIDAVHGARFKTSARIAEIKNNWPSLLINNGLTPAESFQRHSQQISLITGLIIQVGDLSNLILDPDLDSYYLVDLTVLTLPELLEVLAQARSLSASVAAVGGFLSQAQLIDVAINIDTIEKLKARVNYGLNAAVENTRNAELKGALSNAQNTMNLEVERFVTKVNTELLHSDKVFSESGDIFSAGSNSISAVIQLKDQVVPSLNHLLETRRDEFKFERNSRLMLVVLFITVALAFGVFMRKLVIVNVASILEVFQAIGEDNYDSELEDIAKDELGRVQTQLLKLQKTLKTNISSIREIADESSRIKKALDVCDTSVMMADANHNIIYMNNAVVNMMSSYETRLSQEIRGFSAKNLPESNVNELHSDPRRREALLSDLSNPHKEEINLAGLTFALTSTPIFDEAGERLGTVVEWADLTDEVAIEKEIDELVEAAGNGDFTKNIELEGKEGFFRVLSEGLNKLMATTEVGINDVSRVLGAIARGDLTESITRDYEGAFGQLKDDANKTVENLTEVMANIRAASNTINSSAGEIAVGNSELSRRTENQAASLEETASSMEEMTSTVRQSADNANHAAELAEACQHSAKQGGEVVSSAITAMQDINESSKKISDIIGVIDEIAFQTNLLALNAAVEAARAGEQGRGFAVVAGEVRNLAQRSASAAKEIKDLIRDSVGKVESGSKLVNDSGETLKNIVESVQKVTSMIEEIACAAAEQTSGIEQVNKAVTSMDEMTQQNAALVEQSSSASEAMADQASGMVQLLEFFTANEGDEEVSAAIQPRNLMRGQEAYSDSVHGSRSAQRRSAPRNALSSMRAGSAAPKQVNDDDDEWEEF